MLFEGRVEQPDVLRVHAMLAIRQERWADAAQYLEEGLGLARQIGMPFHEALLLEQCGRMQESRGDTAAARQSLEQSLVLLKRLGAAPFAQRVEHTLARSQ
jgi:uncharacterized protein HemY